MRKSTYFYSLLLTALFLLPWSGMKAEQLNEGFEGTDFVPEGWSTIHVSGTATWVKYAGSYSNYGHESKTCAKVSWGPADNYLITPQLRPASGEKLSFYAASTSYGGSTLEIMVSTTNNSSASSFSSMSPAKSYSSNSSDIPSGSWNKIEIDLSSYLDQDIYVAFRVTDNDGDAVYIDDVSGVTLKPESCPKTSVPTASNVGATTATISWTENGSATAWNLQYKKSSDSEWTNIVVNDEPTYNLTELVAGGTSYDYRVQADCGGGDVSDWKEGVSFETNCVATAIGWSENFDGLSSLPSCWKASSYGSGYGQWYMYSNSARFNARVSSSTYADLTTLPVELTEKAYLSFYHQNGSPAMEVYINDGTSTTLLRNIAKKSSNTQDTIHLSAYTGKTVKFIFRAYGYSAYSSTYAYLDDVEVKYLPIAVPTSLAATPTADGAVVTWAHAENGPFDLQYRATGTEDWTTVNNINAKTYTIEGLNEVEYEVQVRAHASEHRISDWTASQTFTPSSCPTVTAAWLSEKTYTGLKVSCTLSLENKKWDLQRKIDDGAWTEIGTEIAATYQEVAVEVGHTYYFQVKPSCGSDWSDAGSFTPEYPTPGTPSVTATTTTASVTWTAADGADGYEYVLMTGETAADWTSPIATTSPLDLNALTDGTNYTIYVRAKYGTGRSAEVSKNFTTETVAPSFTTADATIEGTTATVALNSYAGSATQLQYVVMNGSAAANWTSATLVAKTTTSIEVPGLSVGGSYTIYVRAYYSSTLQSAADSKFFEIPCETQSLPFAVEGFDHSGNLPTCWDNSTYSGNAWTMDNGNYYKSASYSARYNANGNSSKYADLKTPSITLSEDALLKFYLRNKVGSSATNKVTAEVYIYDGTTTTKLDDIPYASSGETTMTQQASMDLSEYTGKTVNIIFRAHGYGASASLYIDNVEIQFKPIDAPTNVAAAATTDGAAVTWEHAENGPFDLKYRTNGVGEWTTINGINAKTYTIEGLNEVEYEVQVRAHASEHRISDWTASQTFTPQCPNVTSVTYTNPTYNSVTVNWEASGSATWSLRYKVDGATEWTTENGLTAQTYNLTGLVTGTAYNVEVKATCKADADYFAAATYTPACSAPSNVTIASITDAAAAASWDAVADAPNGYKYIVVEAGETPNWASATATEELTASLSGLAGLTDYDFYVAAVYGDHVEAAEKVNFQTVAVAPTALTQGTTTVNSIAFSWSYAGAATQFQWKSSKAGSVWSAPISATNAEEIGLTAGTPYTIYVRAYYADGKYSSELSETFGTECAVLSLPFSQDFEDGVSPLCWTAATSTADYYDYDGNYGWKVAEDNDGNYVMRYKSAAGVIYPVLTLPQIDLTATPAVLSFKVLNNYSNKTVAGNVTVSAEGVEDLVTTLTTSSSLTEQRIDLTAFAGKRITVKFQATSNAASGRIDLDDVRILEQLNLADADNNTSTLSANMGKTLDVTIGRTFKCADYYNTICLPFDLPTLTGTPLEGGELWAFKYMKVEGDELLIRIIEASSINAGEPYLISFPAGADIVNPLFKNVTITASVGQAMGDDNNVQFRGILAPETFTAGDNKKLFVAENNMLYWWAGTTDSKLNSFRAYFYVNTGTGSGLIHGMPARFVKIDDTITGVENVQGDVQSLKVLENNQVVIIRNGVKYTIQGQVISK